jgi:hypothetical protein
MSHLGSPATIHKNYHLLIDAGYLEHVDDPRDRRIKYIVLTNASKQFYNKINDLMIKCVNMQKSVKK